MKSEKTKYSIWDNVCFMFRIAWSTRKDVILTCGIIAFLNVGVNLVQLLIAPKILEKVERLVPLSELLLSIISLSLLLFALMALRSYFTNSRNPGRIEVRAAVTRRINQKTYFTSYPNTINPSFIRMQRDALESTSNNYSATQHIWFTLTVLLTNLLSFAVYLVFLSELNPVLVFVVLVTTVVGFFVTKQLNQWGYTHREDHSRCISRLNYVNTKVESEIFAKDIRIFNLKSWIDDIQESTMRMYRAFIYRREGIYLIASIVDVILTFARNGFAYIILINFTLSHDLPASDFLLFFSAIGGFTKQITGILGCVADLHRESLEISVIQEYINYPEIFCFDQTKSIPEFYQWELILEDVTYTYPGADNPTISNLNLTVHSGERIAIVGLNGAGKTTLIKMLCGLIDPDSGRVLLNGIDIKTFNRKEYYGLFSAVFQQFSILNATIAENIAQCITGIDYKKVWDCLHKADISEDIMQYPEGLNTHVGRDVYQDGIVMSGGQLQRLLLARALYKDAPILILDEPTAALDAIAEDRIYKQYSKLTCGKTAVFISHRLASTRFCDRIVYLADGEIIEEGTHNELMAQNGEYCKMFEIQSQYYRED